jgi:hypothetical protein
MSRNGGLEAAVTWGEKLATDIDGWNSKYWLRYGQTPVSELRSGHIFGTIPGKLLRRDFRK